MKRLLLRNKYLKNGNKENRILYTELKSYCVSLLRKTKKVHYENLGGRKVSKNKIFWKTLKLYYPKSSMLEKG